MRIEKAQLVSRSRLATAWEGSRAGLYGAYLLMEGTLGAADCVLLRGRMPEAALVDHACVVRRRWAREIVLACRVQWVDGISSQPSQRARDRRCPS